MKQIEMDTITWDWKFTEGSLTYVTGAKRVAQRNRQTLQTFLGEYFLNTLLGIPYYEYFFVKNPDVNRMAGYLREGILRDPEVEIITEMVMEIEDRQLETTYKATTTDGTVTENTLTIQNNLEVS